jgi:acyl transferase domain-containing protein
LKLWVKGLKVDWQQLYGARRPRTISLPTYPFAREIYWAESLEPAARPTAAAVERTSPSALPLETSDAYRARTREKPRGIVLEPLAVIRAADRKTSSGEKVSGSSGRSPLDATLERIFAGSLEVEDALATLSTMDTPA